MDASKLFTRLLWVPTHNLSLLATSVRPHCNARLYKLLTSTRTFTTAPSLRISNESLPRVVQPSLWQSLIPKPLRRSKDAPKRPRSKEWNPATTFVILGLLTGSQSIQLMVMRRDKRDFSRKADAKIALLREVIERVKSGEEVDVEGLLGTGDKAKEKEWEEVLAEIEAEEESWRSKRKKREAEVAEAAAAAEQQAKAEAAALQAEKERAQTSQSGQQEPRRQVGFY